MAGLVIPRRGLIRVAQRLPRASTTIERRSTWRAWLLGDAGRSPLALPGALGSRENHRRRGCALPGAQIIRKIRYEIRHHDGLVWSVDRFQGANAGLVHAEVGLDGSDQPIDLPPWVGAEVMLDQRYGNSRLARRPVSAPQLAGAA